MAQAQDQTVYINASNADDCFAKARGVCWGGLAVWGSLFGVGPNCSVTFNAKSQCKEPAASAASAASTDPALPIVAIAAGAGILWWLLKTKKKA